MTGLLELLQRGTIGAALALPDVVKRGLVGPPAIVDGEPLALDVQLLLWLMRVAKEAPVETMPIPDGRVALDKQVRMSAGHTEVGEVRSLSVDGADGPLPARLYVPTTATWPEPLLVFFHGGGFIYGSLDAYDEPCRLYAQRAGVRVLSIDYRLAPEHRHPAQRDDCVAAYRWALEHLDELGADPAHVGVGGDSAGGWLAASVALAAAREGLPCAFELLLYPVADLRGATTSRALFADGYFLTKDFMDLAENNWLSPADDRASPDVSPVFAEIPPGLAPAYVATCGFDPLRDEGEAYAARMRAAGVPVELERFGDQIHGFISSTRLPSSRAAALRTADALRRLVR